MESNDTITAVGSGSGINILATLGVGFTIPSVTIASDYRFLCVLCLVNGQVESNNTITAVSSGGSVNVVATLGIGVTIPRVGFSIAYSGRIIGDSDLWKDGEV